MIARAYNYIVNFCLQSYRWGKNGRPSTVGWYRAANATDLGRLSHFLTILFTGTFACTCLMVSFGILSIAKYRCSDGAR